MSPPAKKLLDRLRDQVNRKYLLLVKVMHEKDLTEGYGSAYLPYALEQKYPNANREWIWQYVFTAHDRSRDPQTGIICRHHIHETAIQNR